MITPPKREEDISKNMVEAFGAIGHISCVESHLSSPGIPDLNICVEKSEFWVELKYIYPKDRKLNIRPTQYRWFRDRVKVGGKCFLLAYEEKKDLYFLVEGDIVRNLGNIEPLMDQAKYVSNSFQFIVGALLKETGVVLPTNGNSQQNPPVV